ncbi:hypothetical protein GCM10027162_25730 [Streptomyces incanus]
MTVPGPVVARTPAPSGFATLGENSDRKKTSFSIERFAEEHGTTEDGYLLRGPKGPFSEPNERYRVSKLFQVLPSAEGVGMCSFRHFFASNALSNGIPVTDVAGWMGHTSIQVAYRTYRHLMPGSITKAAMILDEQLRAVL